MHFNMSFFYGLCYFLLSLMRTSQIQGWLMIVSGYFYLHVYIMGETTIQVVSDKKTKGCVEKKGRSKGKAAFFENKTNYFSLLDLKLPIERFGSIKMLWEGESVGRDRNLLLSSSISTLVSAVGLCLEPGRVNCWEKRPCHSPVSSTPKTPTSDSPGVLMGPQGPWPPGWEPRSVRSA